MPRDNRCMYMTHVCLYVCCSDYVGICRNVCCVAAVIKNTVSFSLVVLKYVVCLCSGCDGCCVFLFVLRAGLITALYVAMIVSFCLPHPVAVSAFMICRVLCGCTEMLWMCVLYVSFGLR